MGEPEFQSEQRRALGFEKATGYPEGLIRLLTHKLRSDDAAKEVAQDAMLRYHKASQRHHIESPINYIFKIALRGVKRFRQRHVPSASLDNEIAERAALRFEGISAPLEDQCLAREQLERMLNAIPPVYRRALWLQKVEGKSAVEIAAELNITPASALVYVSRGLAAALKVKL